MKKNSFAYRFVMLLVIYLFLISVLLVSLASIGTVDPVVFWIVSGVSIGLFIVIVIANELMIRKKNK